MREEQRNLLLIALAASTVATPLIIGAIKKQIPKDVLIRWAAPLMATTFLMVIGIRLFDQYLDAAWKLSFSLFFGLLWLLSGILVMFLKLPEPSSNQLPKRARKTFGLILITFGILWMAASVFRFG